MRAYYLLDKKRSYLEGLVIDSESGLGYHSEEVRDLLANTSVSPQYNQGS